jgi:hypothetical protein
LTTTQEELIRLRVRFDSAEIRNALVDIDKLNNALAKTGVIGNATSVSNLNKDLAATEHTTSAAAAAAEQLGTSLNKTSQTGAAAVGNLNKELEKTERIASDKSIARLNQELSKMEKAGGNTAGKRGTKGGYGNGMGILAVSQAFEDMQYGIGAVLNNIPMMVMALGGGPGMAGALSAAAVAANVLSRNMGEIISEKTKTDWHEWIRDLSRETQNFAKRNGDPFLVWWLKDQTKQEQRAADDAEATAKKIKEQKAKTVAEVQAMEKETPQTALGEDFNKQLNENGGAGDILDKLVGARGQQDEKYWTDYRLKEYREAMAGFIKEAIKGNKEAQNVILNELSQTGQKSKAMDILKQLLPSDAEEAKRIAKEKFGKLGQVLGEAWAEFDAGAPKVSKKQADAAAGKMQGQMESAGVEADVQKAIAEFFGSDTGKRFLKFVPMILPVLADAGLNQRETYEALLQIGQLMASDGSISVVQATQMVLLRAQKGEQEQMRALMNLSPEEQAAREGAAMLGLPTQGEGESTRFRRTRKSRGGGRSGVNRGDLGDELNRQGGPRAAAAAAGGGSGGGGRAGGGGGGGGPAGFSQGRRMIAIQGYNRGDLRSGNAELRRKAARAKEAGLAANEASGGVFTRVKPRGYKTLNQAIQAKRQRDAETRQQYQAMRQQIDNALQEIDKARAEFKRQYVTGKLEQQDFYRRQYPAYHADKPERSEEDFGAEWDQMHGNQFEQYKRAQHFNRSGFPYMPRPGHEDEQQEGTPDAEFGGWNTTGEASREQLQFNGEMLGALKNIEQGADPMAEAIAQQREELRNITAQTYQRMGSP